VEIFKLLLGRAVFRLLVLRLICIRWHVEVLDLELDSAEFDCVSAAQFVVLVIEGGLGISHDDEHVLWKVVWILCVGLLDIL